MSRTKLDALQIAAVLVGLAVATAGCSTLSKSKQATPSPSRPGDFSDDDDLSGRFFNRGQASSSPSQADNQVQQASLDRSLPAEVSNQAVAAAVVDSADEEDQGFDIEDLDPANLYRVTRDAFGYGPDEGIARDLFHEAEELARGKLHKAAGKKFLAAAKRWPDSSLEEDALFLAGENFFAADEYPDAHKAYQKLLKGHDYTHRLDQVTKRLFAMAQYWEQCAARDPSIKSPVNLTDDSRPWTDTVGHALKAYDDIRMYDPTGPLADDSVMATANLYFVRGRYEDAARHYDLLRTEYAKSEHQLKAHLLGIESWQRIYQGGYYDAGPLDKAAEVADQALIQFGPELGEERPRIVEAKNKIIEEKAARDMIIGKYYDKNERFGAARFYYQSIVEEYPQTVAAQQARQRLTEIQDEPDKPRSRFDWFTKMFEREQYE
jgi:TolA-binding protein